MDGQVVVPARGAAPAHSRKRSGTLVVRAWSHAGWSSGLTEVNASMSGGLLRCSMRGYLRGL
jgi:hypothetical protein